MSRRPGSSPHPSSSRVLGIECGATRSVALLVDGRNRLLQRIEAGPANVRLIDDRELLAHLQGIAERIGAPAAIGIGMAGVVEDAERERVRRIAKKVWPGCPCWVGNDLETALAAVPHAGQGPAPVRIIVISGTGSSCYGVSTGADGKGIMVGGWGHLLGDLGSGYDIALRGLKAAVRCWDQTGDWPGLGRRLLKRLGLSSPNALVSWAQVASKPEIASLARAVFLGAARGDRIARRVLVESADDLADRACWCAARVVKPGEAVEFVFTGSVLIKAPEFGALVQRAIRRRVRRAAFVRLQREAAWGAVQHARKIPGEEKLSLQPSGLNVER